MLEHQSSTCPSIAQASCSEQCKSSNARTYGRTHKEPLTFWSYLKFVNAYRGGKRFRQLGDETAPTASAPRSLQAVTHA